MSKSENIHHTIKWKKRRKDHFGDMCNSGDCKICAAHKNWGNSKKAKKAKDLKKMEAFKFTENEF